MKNRFKILLTIITIMVWVITSCSENSSINSENTSKPQIQSLITDKLVIEFGGQDPAIITCNAIGGELEYTWEVDLGDIFPVKSDNSVVRFSGSPCCIGKKIITCSVTNNKGSDSKTIEILIKEP